MHRAPKVTEEPGGRRPSRAATTGGHLLCLFIAVAFGAMALSDVGALRVLGSGVCVAALLLEAALITVTRPQSSLPVRPRSDGSVVVESPLYLSVMLLGAWLSAGVGTLGWVVATVVHPAGYPGSRGMLTLALVMLASTPDLVRLLRGRLHRWRIDADEHQVRYRGYRTDVTVSWSEVATVRSTPWPPAITLVRRDGELPVVVPGRTFSVEPASVAAALTDLRRRRSRRPRSLA